MQRGAPERPGTLTRLRVRATVLAGVVRFDRRMIGLLGLGATGVIVLACVISALAYIGSNGQPYSPLNHYVWELGDRSQSRLAWVFNSGFAVGGVGLGLYRVLLARQTKGWWRAAFIVLGLIAGVSGALLGLFPMDDLNAHTVASIGFFNAWWVAIAIFSLWLLVHPRQGFPGWLIAPSALVLVVFLAFLGLTGSVEGTESLAVPLARPERLEVAVLEWITMGALVVWFTATSVVLIRSESR